MVFVFAKKYNKTQRVNAFRGTHETIDVTNMSSLPTKMDEVNTDTPLRGAWLERIDMRIKYVMAVP